MPIRSLLIANRGEIAIRIARAAADLGIRSVAVYSPDDADSLHTRIADEAVALDARGVPAYLDIEAIVAAAVAAGCDAVHPGYGFLAENAGLARACATRASRSSDPASRTWSCSATRAAPARRRPSRTCPRSPASTARSRRSRRPSSWPASAPAGRSCSRRWPAAAGAAPAPCRIPAELAETFERCRSEAASAFGNGALYVEQYLPRARHIEVQIVGDRHGAVAHVGERECSVQRRYQKIIEVAPAPHLPADLRNRITNAAVRFATHVAYDNLGTFEFLVDASQMGEDAPFFFIETNARLQVEHTVTEAVTGVDLVQTQLRIAGGESLADVGFTDPSVATPRGYAIQARVNMETITATGEVRPSGGLLTAYDAPSGPGVRTDGFGYSGYRTSPSFDSLLAKVITHSPSGDFGDAVARSARALSEFRIEGVQTNIPFLRAVLAHPDFAAGRVYTRFLDHHAEALATAAAANGDRQRFVVSAPPVASGGGGAGFAGAQIDNRDPLALFEHDRSVKETQAATAAAEAPDLTGPDGSLGLPAPIQGTVVSVLVAEGDTVHAGQQVAVMEAMKMEHVIKATVSGIVRGVTVAEGDVIIEGHPLVYVEEADVGAGDLLADEAIDPDFIRGDLQEIIDRHAYTLDENRPEAVAKRRKRGYRMPRENIAQLIDEGSLLEYWPLIVARQHQRYDAETLRKNTPADGLVAGTCTINADLFGEEAARASVVSYDYTVLAGTQGGRNHYKQDRMFDLCERYRLPLVFFTEGGGGRPGDDRIGPGVAFDTYTFTRFSKLSGLVPLIGVSNGRCFAGNTALLACCDVIIATEGSTIAMGGPAMIEGGGVGIYTPEEVGPMSFQVPNGVVDILTKDEEEACEVAKKYLSYFQGPIDDWEAHDQRRLRHVVPENRLRLYDMKEIIATIADVDSVLEIREKFGIGVITAFIRVEGKPMGVIANNPHHLAGAIDSDGADKGARFIQLCDAFDIPVLSLMDCPGMMVGPDVERTALVRHCVRMFNAGANLTTPLLGVVVRKAYGLGVQAMCGASSLVGFFTVAWPTAEFAGMNIEGEVKLGYRNELAAIEDPEERIAEYESRVARRYENAKAVNSAVGGGIDDVIDPADTRAWIATSLKRLPPTPPRTEKKYPYIDTW